MQKKRNFHIPVIKPKLGFSQELQELTDRESVLF